MLYLHKHLLNCSSDILYWSSECVGWVDLWQHGIPFVRYCSSCEHNLLLFLGIIQHKMNGILVTWAFKSFLSGHSLNIFSLQNSIRDEIQTTGIYHWFKLWWLHSRECEMKSVKREDISLYRRETDSRCICSFFQPRNKVSQLNTHPSK